jgi:hypothetical protein
MIGYNNPIALATLVPAMRSTGAPHRHWQGALAQFLYVKMIPSYGVPQAKQVLDEILERLPPLFDMEDIRSRVDDFTPYVMVAIQVSVP